MKIKLLLFLWVVLSIAQINAQSLYIDSCFVQFRKSSGLTVDQPSRMLATADKTRSLRTADGFSEISILDGYRILYSNPFKKVFVNMKVELASRANYLSDSTVIVQHLQYLQSSSEGMEPELLQPEYNGFKAYGISRDTLDESRILSVFTVFPGEGIIIYLYFNNTEPSERTFSSMEAFRMERDLFLQEFTAYLRECVKR